HEQSPTAAGNLGQVFLEITADGGDFDTGVFTLDGRRGRRQHVRVDVERDEPAQRAAVAQRVQQHPGLLRRPAAQLDQGVRAGGGRDLCRVFTQDLRLGTG